MYLHDRKYSFCLPGMVKHSLNSLSFHLFKIQRSNTSRQTNKVKDKRISSLLLAVSVRSSLLVMLAYLVDDKWDVSGLSVLRREIRDRNSRILLKYEQSNILSKVEV